MIFRCKEPFETREDGRRTYIDKDTIWIASNAIPALGGYELMLIEEIDTSSGRKTGFSTKIRMNKLSTNFDKVPMDDIFVPTRFHISGKEE
jgi:hypothetical protein